MITPLGLPVVPEVYSSVTGSDGLIARPARRPRRAARPAGARPSSSSASQVTNRPSSGGHAVGIAHHDGPQAGQPVEYRPPAGQLGRAIQDGDHGVAVAGHVGDLLGGQGGVEGHRDAARVHRAQVGQDVLGAVRQHHPDPLARLQAKRDEPGRHREGQLPGLTPGDRLPLAAVGPGVGVGRLIGVLARGRREQVAERAPARQLLDLRPAGRGSAPRPSSSHLRPPARPPSVICTCQ